MRSREHPHAPAYEQELVTTVAGGDERWLTELRLAIVGIVISVALGAADIALSLSTWPVALAVGIGSTLVFVGLLWRLRPRARRESPQDLRWVDDELARIKAELDGAGENPARDLLEALAAAADAIARAVEQIADEAFLETESADLLHRLRDYDRRAQALAAEIRCRRKAA